MYKKNAVKKADKFGDDTSASKEKRAGDNRAFQISGIQIPAKLVRRNSTGNV